MRNGRISYGQGRTLLELDDPNQQRHFAQMVIQKGLTVRELDSVIKQYTPKFRKRRMLKADRDPQVVVFEDELQHIFATKVRIAKRKQRGHIIIEFYSNAELQRIMSVLRGGHRV